MKKDKAMNGKQGVDEGAMVEPKPDGMKAEIAREYGKRVAKLNALLPAGMAKKVERLRREIVEMETNYPFLLEPAAAEPEKSPEA